MSRTLDFDFKRLLDPSSNTRTADGESRPWDEYVPTQVRGVGNRLVLLNGVNANSQIPLVAGLTVLGSPNQPSIVPLLMASPSATLFPMLSFHGEGNVFGTNYVWRIRYKNSQTGDVSGMSPIPAWRINMGKETTQGANTYVGQKAFFYIACGVNDVPSYCDTIQLIRNASGDEKVWYVQSEQKIGSASYLLFIDDTTDAELVFNETAGLLPNPSYDEGTLPPLCKLHQHSDGSTWYYGQRRMGPYRTGTVSVTVGSVTVTRTSTDTAFDIARVGQRFRMTSYGGNTVDDVTVYRITAVASSGASLTVTPPIQASTYLPTLSTTYTSVSFEILDDRDLRTVYPSQPGLPTNFDLLDAFGIGFDADDQLCSIFTLRGITYGHTTHGLYRLVNDVSTDVTATIAIQKVSEDGIAGFEAGCVTPDGWAFVNPTRGILLFDGNAPPQGYETLGTVSPCVPLGSEDEKHPFQPHDQFFGEDTDAYSSLSGMVYTGFEESLISESRVFFDSENHLLHVFYVPKNLWTLSEEMAWDFDTGCWRGPWRRCATAAGVMRNAGGTDIFVIGDDCGNLWRDQLQDYDMLAASAPAAATNSTGTGYVLVASGTPFDATTYQQQGVPILLYSPTGVGTAQRALQWARIIDVIDNATLVLDSYVLESGFTYTYQVAGIRHLLQTAWIDAGEPVQPKEFEFVRMRLVPQSSGASTATIATMIDGDESLANVTGEGGNVYVVDPANTAEKGYCKARIKVMSRLAAFVFYGTSKTPVQVTAAVADVRVDSGS